MVGGGKLLGHPFGDLGRLQVELVGTVGPRPYSARTIEVAAERIGLDDVAPGLQIIAVDVLHGPGAGDHQILIAAVETVLRRSRPRSDACP